MSTIICPFCVCQAVLGLFISEDFPNEGRVRVKRCHSSLEFWERSSISAAMDCTSLIIATHLNSFGFLYLVQPVPPEFPVLQTFYCRPTCFLNIHEVLNMIRLTKVELVPAGKKLAGSLDDCAVNNPADQCNGDGSNNDEVPEARYEVTCNEMVSKVDFPDVAGTPFVAETNINAGKDTNKSEKAVSLGDPADAEVQQEDEQDDVTTPLSMEGIELGSLLENEDKDEDEQDNNQEEQ
ncbi:hypothetical protein CONPUDRAFT_77040 [Coniophora puteana RWD-64-598 SS2]|uniref:Uncharacterized protein n=1 Tax=Coniophora puteana (strain RWD-64-598) TaxID=741705 RepID=A0A5M3MB40_CONPW|nr:uncharacterized protein CONPUDRAFT_77040 [Coniophora puteana RWD-64-598 SS2]EIW76020.1 hypothetical protein CONPUDRAFT_77040 [Coniophora puteana RWD-64-598 SS2]